MASILRNKLKIIPNAYSEEERLKQINDVAAFCSATEDGVRRNLSFANIAPKPTGFTPESKEEDDWLLHNWGTRTRALNACWLNDEEMIFDTFWNPPIPIIKKIIENFKDIDFEYKFASKKAGTKAGEINASGGEIISLNLFEDYSVEAYETAFELMPHLKEQFVLSLKTNNYIYDASILNASIEQKGFYKDEDGTILIGKKTCKNNADNLPF